MPQPLNRRIRNAAGANAVRVRKPRPGQTPPINRNQPGGPQVPQPPKPVPGQTPPTVPAPPAPNALPTLNANQRQMLQEWWKGNGGNFQLDNGNTAMPIGAVRRAMRTGMANGMGRGQVNNLLSQNLQAFDDPYGRAGLLKYATQNPELLKQMAAYLGQNPTGRPFPGVDGSASGQTGALAAIPELHQQYMAMANTYKNPASMDATNPNDTPPNATLGEDGRYHDPTKPLPGSQPTAQPTTAQTPGIAPEKPVATPEAAAAAGKDPTKHIAYWESVGWSFNPATGAWTDRNGDRPNPTGNPNQPNQDPHPNNPQPGQTPPIPGPTPTRPETGAGVPGGQPTGVQPSSQLPLDPYYEAQRRGLDANLQRQLAQVNAGQGRLTAEQELAMARMNTNQGVDQQRLLENMASRGTMQSSIYGDQTGLLATDYQRQHQDLASSIADAMAGLSGQEADAQSTYEQGLIEALLGSAQNSANDPYAPTPRPTKPKKPKRPRARRRGK